MKSLLRTTVCAAAVALASPAFAQTTPATSAPATPMHHRHHVVMRHTRYGKMGVVRGKHAVRSAGDAETAKLNAESLQKAQGSQAASPAPAGTSAPAGSMAPPAGSTPPASH